MTPPKSPPRRKRWPPAALCWSRKRPLPGRGTNWRASAVNCPGLGLTSAMNFNSPNGKETLGDLFAGRHQLIVQHFMFGPDWQEGCVGCSFNADHVDGAIPHIQARDATFVAISRAPLAKLQQFASAWAGASNGCQAMAATSTTISTSRFASEEIAAGRAQYNYRPLDFEIEDLSGFSIFYRTATVRSSTPIPPLRAATKC